MFIVKHLLLIYFSFLFFLSCSVPVILTNDIQSPQLLEKEFLQNYRITHSNANRRNYFSKFDFVAFEYRLNENTEDVEVFIVAKSGLYDGFLLDSITLMIESIKHDIKVESLEQKEYLEILQDAPSQPAYFNKFKAKIPVSLILKLCQSNYSTYTFFTDDYFYTCDISDFRKSELLNFIVKGVY